MTDTSTHEEPQTQAAVEAAAPTASAPPRRPDDRWGVLRLGAVVGSAAGSMLFAGLVAGYLSLRDAVPPEEWPTPGVEIPNVAVLTLTIGLAMSAVTAGWAYYASLNEDRRGVLSALGLTLVLAAAHVNGLIFVWDALTLPVAESTYSAAVYALTGTHLAFVIAGMAAIAALLVRALGGQLTGRSREPALAFLIGWEFVVTAWIAVYVFVFLVK